MELDVVMENVIKHFELLEALVDSFLAAADAPSDVTHLCILIMHCTGSSLDM
jgi:hypothetical protein